MPPAPANDDANTPDAPVAAAAIDDTASPSPQQTLAILRVLWLVLFAGQFVLIGIAAMVIHSSAGNAMKPDLTLKLFGFNAGLLVFNILLGTFLRSQIYKRSWRGDVIAPLGYFTGNVVMIALLEMVIFFGILISILSKSFNPSIWPAVLAMLVYGVNYPHGGPMFGSADPGSLNFTKATPEAIDATHITSDDASVDTSTDAAANETSTTQKHDA